MAKTFLFIFYIKVCGQFQNGHLLFIIVTGQIDNQKVNYCQIIHSKNITSSFTSTLRFITSNSVY